MLWPKVWLRESVLMVLNLLIKQKDKIPNATTNFDTLDEITEKDIKSWKSKIFGILGIPDDSSDDIPDIDSGDDSWTADY